MTRTKAPQDDAFAQLVRRDVFGETTDAEKDALRSPKHAERFQVYLTRVVQSTNDALANHHAGTHPRSEKWVHDASMVHDRYSRRLAEVRPIVKEYAHRRAEGDAAALLDEVSRLRGAIRLHQAASEAAEVQPEDHDLDLWSVLLKAANA